jgi:predicted nuclease with TOPRIM domain
MKEQLQQRIQSLKTEYEAGQKMLADLEAKQAKLRDTLLRINGAIQVLEEILAPEVADTEIDNGDLSPSAVPVEAVSASPS